MTTGDGCTCHIRTTSNTQRTNHWSPPNFHFRSMHGQHMLSGWWFTRTFLLIGLYLCNAVSPEQEQHSAEDDTKEYCSNESFRIACHENEVILMKGAIYGRMKSGRCISGEYGHSMGCYADVVTYMDAQCSGQRHCTVVVGALDQVAQPCPKDFKSYLEASYSCRSVISLHGGTCGTYEKLRLPASGGQLAANILLYGGHDLSNCIWSVDAPLGQILEMTLFSFNAGTQSQQPKPQPQAGNARCAWFVVVRDRDKSIELDLCSTHERQDVVFTSSANVLELNFYGSGEALPRFILEYQAVGCADVEPPSHAWLRREADNLMVRCNDTSETWYLTCRGNDWMGEIGNCTSKSPTANKINGAGTFFQKGVAFAVFIGLVLGLVIGVGMLGIVFCCKRRLRRNLENPSQTDVSDRSRPSDSYPGLLRQEKMIGGNVCEYTHVWEVRPGGTPPMGSQHTPHSNGVGGPGGEDLCRRTGVGIGGMGEEVNLDILAGTMKPAEHLYECRAGVMAGQTGSLSRDPRLASCPKADRPMYFEFDPGGNAHVCAAI